MPDTSLTKSFLLPGDYVVTRKPSILSTLLGSCVSVCIRHRSSSLAAMNHYLLSGRDNVSDGRFGEYSLNKIWSRLQVFDQNVKNFKASIFGGASVLESLDGQDIGARNIQLAIDFLKYHKIRVSQSKTGGTKGRRVDFDTATGKIECRFTAEPEPLVVNRTLQKKTLRVMIVDDSRLVREVIRNALEVYQDIEVVAEASDPYESREKLLEVNPDIITLDIIMPKMNGLDFLERVMKYLPRPVIIISSIAKAGNKIVKKANSLGAVDVFDKADLKIYENEEKISKVLYKSIKSAPFKFKAAPL